MDNKENTVFIMNDAAALIQGAGARGSEGSYDCEYRVRSITGEDSD